MINSINGRRQLNILLLGEYSGFFTNLKQGFEISGHKVCFYHDGDGDKKIGGEHFPLKSGTNSRIRQFKHLIRLANNIKNFDLVIFINPNVVGALFSKVFYKIIRKNNNIVFVSSCGDTSYLIKSVKKKEFKYYVFDDDKSTFYPKITTDYEKPFFKQILSRNDRYIMKSCDRIIPSAYEYAIPFKNFSNLSEGIPLPIKIPRVEPNYNLNTKIIIYYGKNKPFFKGASYIEPALMRLANDFSDNVEVIIQNRVSYDEYKKIIDNVDIVVDQCKSYGWGMNALISMAKGKVVASGAEQEALDYFGLKEVPIINIIPNEEQIYKALKEVITDRDKLIKLKQESYEFVKKFHNCELIAHKYIELWEEVISDNAQ